MYKESLQHKEKRFKHSQSTNICNL